MRVGPSGQVLATDLDPRFLDDHGHDNLEVRRHEITADPLPEGLFDLVHSRAAPAEIVERFALPSTDGPVEHRTTVCVRGHVRTPLADIRPALHRAGRKDR
jgi:hypothetical protein